MTIEAIASSSNGARKVQGIAAALLPYDVGRRESRSKHFSAASDRDASRRPDERRQHGHRLRELLERRGKARGLAMDPRGAGRRRAVRRRRIYRRSRRRRGRALPAPDGPHRPSRRHPDPVSDRSAARQIGPTKRPRSIGRVPAATRTCWLSSWDACSRPTARSSMRRPSAA